MNYLILDLEWNNAYIKKRNTTLNEIIEVGAVLLNEKLEIIDTFRSFIKAALGKKLHVRVKELTNISNTDINSGSPFTHVMCEFRKWLGGRDCVLLTWGFTDIKVLSENFKYFCGANVIPFLRHYADLQSFVQKSISVNNSQQLGLKAGAEYLDIPTDDLELHRALSDSIIAARCFKALPNSDEIKNYIVTCDDNFYRRMEFKPYYIMDLNDPEIDPHLLRSNCPYCKCQMKQVKKYVRRNNSFVGVFYCSLCSNEYFLTLRFKRRFDGLEVKRKLSFVEQNTVGAVPKKNS